MGRDLNGSPPAGPAPLSRRRWRFERVFVVRHGQTEWNRTGRRQGQLDSPLTEEGRRLARALGLAMRGLPADGVFASPLGRARATAEMIAAALGQDVRVVDDLAEVHHGDFAGLTNDEIDQRHPGALARRADARFTWRFPGGESYQDADRRAEHALGMIEAAGWARPALVTHEMIARMLFRNLLNLGPADALRRSLGHGVIYEVAPAQRTVTTTEVPDPATSTFVSPPWPAQR